MTRMRAFILAEVLFIVMIVAGVFFYMNRDDDVADRLTEYRATPGTGWKFVEKLRSIARCM